MLILRVRDLDKLLIPRTRGGQSRDGTDIGGKKIP